MKNRTFPAWYDELHQRLSAMAEHLQEQVTGWQVGGETITPEDLGYPGGLATASIQAAIDKAAENGGGTVLIRSDMVTGTLVMKSHVRLMIAEGARLMASTDLADFPEHICQRITVQDTHMGMNQALIFAEGCENICLCGPGEIDGRGTQDNFPGG